MSRPFAFATDELSGNDIIGKKHDMTIYPIWKDIILNATAQLSSGKVDFAVYKDSQSAANLIYSGTAYADAANTCNIRLNDIFKDYLGRETRLYVPNITDAGAARLFVVVYGSASATYKVVNDWSYITGDFADTAIHSLNGPVRDWYDINCFPAFCFTGVAQYYWQYCAMNGTIIAEASGTAAFPSVMFTTNAATYGEGYYELWLSPSGSETPTKFRYYFKDNCKKDYLYYRNKWGGFDVLPLASVVENESYERETYEVSGDTNVYRDNHISRQLSEKVTKTFTLRTPVLTDAEAARMDNVLGSPQAWLGYDAVTVKAGAWKRKTFKNEGRKRVVYEFDVEFAQPMERR